MTSMSTFAQTVMNNKYAQEVDGRREGWSDIAARVGHTVMDSLYGEQSPEGFEATDLIDRRLFVPGGRYLYATGRAFNQVNNCFLLSVEDSREGWGDLLRRSTIALSTGGGVGVVYSNVRPSGSLVSSTGATASGPLSVMQMVNEVGRYIMQGGSRRSALWAGLHWNHGDIEQFIGLKNWTEEQRAAKERDYMAPAPMDGTNISVILDDAFFVAFHDPSHPQHALATDVYWTVVAQMCETGEPGFSVDVGENAGEHLRNACTEVTSADDNDVCNLGSLNMARFDNIVQWSEAVETATKFLLAGTVYSALPYDEVHVTREKNRRLGLGLMGITEWLAKRGKPYGPDAELADWLDVYTQATELAHREADSFGMSRPTKTRAIAPAGTISIVAETTSGMEPIFAKAFKRRYFDNGTWKYQYVVDSSTKRFLDAGVDPNDIEDAYDLAKDVERRVEMQTFLQSYVDHGISSTINLPAWGTEFNGEHTIKDFGNMLIDRLPNVRGVTVYPDGSRGGQPLTPVALDEALAMEGLEFEENGNENACVGGVCGI